MKRESVKERTVREMKDSKKLGNRVDGFKELEKTAELDSTGKIQEYHEKKNLKPNKGLVVSLAVKKFSRFFKRLDEYEKKDWQQEMDLIATRLDEMEKKDGEIEVISKCKFINTELREATRRMGYRTELKYYKVV